MTEPRTITDARGIAGQALSSPQPADELLHRVSPGAHYTTTETSYFGFNIPQQLINGEIYLWFHPALGVMSASVYIWHGLKGSTLACEYINHVGYRPMINGDIDNYRIDELGLHIKVIKPLKEIAIECQDESRGLTLSINYQAIMPAAGRPGGQHFVQPMRTRGSLTLKGTSYVIDGYFTRDRSWTGLRAETSRRVPPITWMVGIFNDDLAIHALAFDDPARSPQWRSDYPDQTSEASTVWGYIRRDGKTIPLTKVSKLTTREADGLAPRVIEMTLTEPDGLQHDVRGTIAARMPWQTWQNMNVYFCMTRWEMDGVIGWGDSQDIQYNDFVHRYHRN